jgi:toxin YoeB
VKTMTYSESRANYAETLDAVVDDREEVVITRAGHEPVVIVALSEYESLKESAYLLRSPENAAPAGVDRPAGARRRNPAGPAGVKLVWDESAWTDYVWWQAQDRKVFKRINALITDIERNGNEGIGKPEPLKHGFQGYWSRRITTDEHRLVYKIVEDEIRIAACRYHYER